MMGNADVDNQNIQPARKHWPFFTNFANLSIRSKLGGGFGILVFLTFVGVVVNFTSSRIASALIGRTEDIRVPSSLLASEAQADLLRMQSDLRTYLATGDPVYRELYTTDSLAFEADLAKLESLGPDLGIVSQVYLQELRKIYSRFSLLPEQLFELRDDQLAREPAYRLLATEGATFAGEVLIATGELIEIQAERAPTPENMEILKELAKFQSKFSALFSALRGYVTTRNPVYRSEFQVNLDLNIISWEQLQESRSLFTPSQQELLAAIDLNRAAFLQLPEQIFAILESDRWREDLYIFQTRAVPLSTDMYRQLKVLVGDQQERLTAELSSGRSSLKASNWLILVSGILAVIVGLLMSLLSQATIAQPILRLTSVAERIRDGELDAQAEIETGDEIGALASTFNRMTTQLRSTLFQAREEKKRADDLLEVVIPIGVELTTERDFNRLLERMLLEAKGFCKAAAGLLLLAEEDMLRYSIVRIDNPKRSLGGTSGNTMPLTFLPLYESQGKPSHTHLATHIALTGETINIPDLSGSGDNFAVYRESFHHDRALANYEIHSLLGIPLKSTEFGEEDKVLGVLLLLNAQNLEQETIIPFDPYLQEMMESLSSLAAAAIEIHNREEALFSEFSQLHIQIDKLDQQKAVEKIVSSDFFRELEAKVQLTRLHISGDAGGQEE